MFSDNSVKGLAKDFVTAHVDPRDSRDASEFKATRYVPEVVFLTSDLKVLTRLNDRTPQGMATLMEKVLKKVKGSPKAR